MYRKRPLGLGSLLLTLAWGVSPASAGAATATTTFQVTANINATCSINATDLDFGDYTGALLNGQSEITLKCTNTTAWNVGLNAGTGAGATVTTRKMTGPATSVLNYALFTDNTRTDNWGDTVGTDTVSGIGSGATQSLQVYGQIPAGQTTAAAGGYIDTITATITF